MEAPMNDSETKVDETNDVDNDVDMEGSDSESNDKNEDSSDNDDDDEEENELRKECETLRKQIDDNPYGYDNHVQLIKNLGELGDLDMLRDARKRMSELFPLTEELWHAWFKDEIALLDEDSDRNEIIKLFEKAVKDYLSVPIWLEYVQFAIGGVGKTDDRSKKLQAIFDSALTACGLHVTQGSLIWETYREYETAISYSKLPKSLDSATEKEIEEFSEHQKKIKSIFTRQLSVPLLNMEESLQEFEEWNDGQVDNNIKHLYKKALIKLEKIKPFEDKLELAMSPRLEEYKEYIKYEIKDGDPARVQCLYERCIQENCLNSTVWLDYTKYLDHTLRVSSVSVDVYERSIRNCPWCVQLWQNYILTLERSEQSYEKVKGVFETALNAGFTQGSEYLAIWTTFIDYLRRRIKWDEEHNEDLETLRLSMEKAIEQLDYFGIEGDPNGSLRQLWATIEAKFCNNMEKARALWLELMAAGRANEAALWMEYFRFERLYGDNKHCRRVLQKALNSVTDWPESIVDAYINFERINGNLEQYEQALSKCEAQMERINERRAKQSEAEGLDTKKKHDKKGNLKGKQQKGGKYQQQQKQQNAGKSQKQQKSDDLSSKQQTNTDHVKPYERKNAKTEDSSDNGFKVPTSVPSKPSKVAPPPGYKPDTVDQSNSSESKVTPPTAKVEKIAPPPGYKGDKGPPPPGYKRSAENIEEPPEKKLKIDSTSTMLPSSSGSKESLTVFVSNLSFDIDEDKIKSFFDKCGAIDEIRLVKNFKGRSKGYAYVQFEDQLAVSNALSYDRTPMDGRPMFVSRYESREEKSKADFKYATSLEKNKLFVKNLPFTCTKEALTTLFSQHGEIKDVRIVTYRSGAPKGLAYVEFVDAQCAAQAVMKTDRLMIGDHEISVAISNPPARKPQTSRDETLFVPTLGGGKKETASRGVARTQVMLMPRAVTKKPGAQSSNTQVTQNKKESTSETSSDSKNSAKAGGMSNSDFRNMLLKK
ncbi:Squamous cell carcinoma antigen recognized by T-cells 3 [Mactra antiquata]